MGWIVAELRWRDNIAGKETAFPWSVPDIDQLEPTEPLVKETSAGRCVLFTDVFDDGTLAIGLVHPSGANFARFSADPHVPHDEAFEGEIPAQIADEINAVWRETIDLFASHQKRLAAKEKGGGEG